MHTDPDIVTNQENRSIRTNYYFFLQTENKPVIRKDKKTELILRHIMTTFIALEEEEEEEKKKKKKTTHTHTF